MPHRIDHFGKFIVIPTAVTIFLVALIVGALLSWSAAQADGIERKRQERLGEFVLKQSIVKLGYEQEAATIWDEAIANVKQQPLDLDWLDNNLGIWFHTYYGHDQSYITDPTGRVIYAMQWGRRVSPAASVPASKEIQTLSSELRSRLVRGDDANAAGAQSPGVADLAFIGGKPMIVSVKPIVTDTGKVKQRPQDIYFQISLRRLDGKLMAGLERDYWFRDAHFALGKPIDPNLAALAFVDRKGKQLGYFVWRPFLPGTEIRSHVAPALAVALCLVALIVGWLLVRIRRSTSQLQASEAQAQHIAFHDALTGLPNRVLFSNRFERALHGVNGAGRIGIILLDLDRFKHVNDTFGHIAGDELIRQFGGRLTALVRAEDMVARLGGDEFVILLDNICGTEDIATLADRILEAVREPFGILGNHAFVGVSMGAVEASGSGLEQGDLLRKADIALYHAKNGGRNCIAFFTDTMDEGVRLRAVIEEELRLALKAGEGLEVYYQPQMSTLTGKTLGLEALVRWNHPTRGLIAPEQFIPVAEETGLVCALGEWVLREACRFSLKWPQLYVAVNLSPVQFMQSEFSTQVIEIIREMGADPTRIELEITEGVLLRDEDFVRDTLDPLRSAGIRIALDDFGTGYSSLRYLRHFDVDKIKIDRSFIQHIGQQVDSAAIVTAIVTLGHAMGMTVTAEGVETREQQRFLESIGCDELQGHLFSPAMRESEIEKILNGRRARRSGIAA